MGYYDLAVRLVNIRARIPQIKMEKTISELGRGEILALNYLSANENEAYPKDMSKALMLTTARIAAILKSLERQGLITRTPDLEDSRQVLVRLTETGIIQIEERREKVIQTTAKMLEALGKDDAEAYVRIQEKLTELGTIWR